MMAIRVRGSANFLRPPIDCLWRVSSCREQMNETISTYIADDHELFREDIKGLIAGKPRFRLVGEAGDGESAWNEIKRMGPEIVLLDINMPGVGGLELAQRIKQDGLTSKVILVTALKEESLYRRGIDLGIEGYVLKDDVIRDLHQALEDVSSGRTFLSPSVSHFNKNSVRQLNCHEAAKTDLDQLTPSELRVLRLLADARDVKFIAKRLTMAPVDVGCLRGRIGAKLKLRGHSALLDFARSRREELRGFKLISEDFE